MEKYNPDASQAARIAFLKEKLSTDERWAVRGLLVIYGYQTADEQESESVNAHNNQGFTSSDGRFLSSLAKQAQNRPLTEKQMPYLLNRMGKYARQLDRHIRNNPK